MYRDDSDTGKFDITANEKGWICPRCECVLAPWVEKCPNCKPVILWRNISDQTAQIAKDFISEGVIL